MNTATHFIQLCIFTVFEEQFLFERYYIPSAPSYSSGILLLVEQRDHTYMSLSLQYCIKNIIA